MRATLARHVDQVIHPDLDRVIGRLFLPSTEPPHVHRARDVMRRVLDLDDATVAELVPQVLNDFKHRHSDLLATLKANAAVLAPPGEPLSEERQLLLGAAFTSEYALEGAALCNPSVVVHPDQGGLAAGELRVAVSLRAIGEGHFSVLEFTTAVVDAERWRFDERKSAPTTGAVSIAPMPRSLFAALVRSGREPDELTLAVLNRVPDPLTVKDIGDVLVDLPPDLLLQPEAPLRVQTLRRWAGSGYTVTFGEQTELQQRVLLPATDDESAGIEDARFTRFKDVDGTVTYRACYTAFNGQRISNRILISPDLRTFDSYPLTGPGATNKGMALFPRKIAGRHLALSRPDGTTIGVTTSQDGLRWGQPANIEGPRDPWQILQVGNAGPPLETSRGWLVITHGVGLMRTYSLGALLLDLTHPARVLARLEGPLMPPVVHAGYVPNVVFTCGAIAHAGRLFIPYGVGDSSIEVASVAIEDLLDSLTPTPGS